MRDSFIFYRSFYEAINDLPDTEQLQIYQAISAFSMDFIEPELTGFAKTIFILIKPQLEANNKRYANGTQPKKKAKRKQNGSKTEANKNKNVNENKNNNKNEEYICAFEKFWLQYPRHKNKSKAFESYCKALKDVSEDNLLNGAMRYAMENAGTDPTKIAHATTWLNGKRWEDEVDPPPPKQQAISKMEIGKQAIQRSLEKYAS